MAVFAGLFVLSSMLLGAWLHFRSKENHSSLVWKVPQDFESHGSTGTEAAFGDSQTDRSLHVTFRQVGRNPAPAQSIARDTEKRLKNDFPGIRIKSRSLVLNGHLWMEHQYVSRFNTAKTYSVHALYSSFLNQEFEVIWTSLARDAQADKLYNSFQQSLYFSESYHDHLR